MNNLQVFQNSEFGEIRAVEINGEGWLVGKDVAQTLGYANTNKAIADHIEEDDLTKRYPIADSLGRTQEVTLINQNGHDIGQKRLFKYLRENGYLMKSGSSHNMPTQKAMELGLFEIKETTINNPDGSIRITKTPKVTGKGQIYFINHFLGERKGRISMSGKLIVARCIVTKNMKTGETISERIEPLPHEDTGPLIRDYAAAIAGELQRCQKFHQYCVKEVIV